MGDRFSKAACTYSNEWILVDTPDSTFGDFFVVSRIWRLSLSQDSVQILEGPADGEPEESRPATPVLLVDTVQPTIPEPKHSLDSDEEPRPKPPRPVKPVETGETVDKFIYRRARKSYARLTSDIRRLNPHHVAEYLFQNNLISTDQLNYAANVNREDSVKATRLANVIFSCDLPRQFQDILKAFEEAGVETVTEIAAEARDLYPGAFLPSSDSENQPSQQFEFDENLKENILKVSADGSGGPAAAVAYINEQVDPKERELLLHKACLDTTDLHTFNIVLLSTEAALINFSDKRVNQRTPLHVACAYLPVTRDDNKTKQQLSKITNLLNREAKATLPDTDGNTPLHLAALRNNAKAVSLILTLDPDSRNIANKLGNTALHIASRQNFLEVAQALCEHKVDARLTNKTRKERTPLHQAVSKGHSMMAGMVLNYEPRSAECVDKKNMSPLLLAAKRREVHIAKRLVKKSLCPVFVIDNEGRTPLHYACVWGSYKLVELLLKANSSRDFVNHKDNKGETALHIAGHHGDTEVLKLLLSNHASKEAVNDFGETPKDAAASAGHSLPSRGRMIKRVAGKLRRGMSKPTLSTSQSCVSLRSTASAHSYKSVSTISATYLHTTDESDLDETV